MITECPKCKSEKLWMIDNKDCVHVSCCKCQFGRSYVKDDMVRNFVCEECGGNNGELHDGKEEITIVCSECNHQQVVFVKKNSFDNRSTCPTTTPKRDVPHCPTCNSTKVKKLSAINRAAHGWAFGLFSKTARSQFVCNNCGYKW